MFRRCQLFNHGLDCMPLETLGPLRHVVFVLLYINVRDRLPHLSELQSLKFCNIMAV